MNTGRNPTHTGGGTNGGAPPEETAANLMTATAISRRIGRSPKAVLDKLRALGIQPAAEYGTVKLYPEDVADTVRDAMRAPNGTEREGGDR